MANPGSTTTKAGNPAPKWDVKDIIPILFNCAPDKCAHFYPILLQEEVYEVKDLFDVGTLRPTGMVNMFGGNASHFQLHLAIVIAFTNFIEKCMSWVVNLGSNPNKDAWICTVRKNIYNAAFKIYQNCTYQDFLTLIKRTIHSPNTPNTTTALSSQSIPNPKAKVAQPPPPPRTIPHRPMNVVPRLPPPQPPPPPPLQQPNRMTPVSSTAHPMTPPSMQNNALQSAPYFSPPAQWMTIQQAFQQSNPLIYGAQPTTPKLKERLVLLYKVSWNGKLSTFETHQRMMEAWAMQYSMQYMFKEEFILRYIQEGWYTVHCYARTGITEEQFMHSKEVLYGAIMSSNKDNPAANKYISMYEKSAHGLAMWYCFLQDYGGLDNLIRKK